MSQFSLAENIIVKMKQVENELGLNREQPESPAKQPLHTSELDVWHVKLASLSLVSDLEPLTQSIQQLGLLQPLLVVKCNNDFPAQNNHSAKYIIIDGYRRYLSCKSLNLPVSINLVTLTSKQALDFFLLQIQGKSYCDYQLGLIYHFLLKDKYIKPECLVKNQGLTFQKLNRLLVFSKLPQRLIHRVGDLSNVSSKTAATLIKIAQLGDPYLQALLQLSQKIRMGYSESRIARLLINKFQLPLPEDIFIEPYHLRVKQGKEVIMDCKENVIRLNKKLLKQTNYQQLVHSLGEVISQWNNTKDD